MLEKIIKIISDNTGIEENKINKDTKLIEDLNIDSLDIVEIAMAIEDEFEVTIEDEDLRKLETVEDIFNYIENN